MKIGFTGSQKGMTESQKESLSTILQYAIAIDFHNGDCIGADLEANRIARAHFYAIKLHPPKNTSKRAFYPLENANDYEFKPKEYLERNKDIVNICDILIACPSNKKEILRSGTWATIRYARRMKKPRIILLP